MTTTTSPLDRLLAAEGGNTITVPADWHRRNGDPDFRPGDVLTHDGGFDSIPWRISLEMEDRAGLSTWYSPYHLDQYGLTVDKAELEPEAHEVDFVQLEEDIYLYLEDLPPASLALRARDITEIVRKALTPEPPKPDWHDAKVITGTERGERRTFLRHYDGEAFITNSGTRWDYDVLASLVSDIEVLVPADV